MFNWEREEEYATEICEICAELLSIIACTDEGCEEIFKESFESLILDFVVSKKKSDNLMISLLAALLHGAAKIVLIRKELLLMNAQLKLITLLKKEDMATTGS